MGCTGSREVGDLSAFAPRPQLHQPTQMNSAQLRRCLGHVADFIHQRRRSLQLIVIGGAVNVILLQSRLTTEDVDVIPSHLSHADKSLLTQAARHVQQAEPELRLENGWLNSNAILFMSSAVRAAMLGEALAQNEVVFSAPGLTLYAAPYQYSVVSKLSRLVGAGQAQSRRDAADVAAYINRYLASANQSHVTLGQIEQWCIRYERQIAQPALQSILQQIAQLYLERFGAEGITLRVATSGFCAVPQLTEPTS